MLNRLLIGFLLLFSTFTVLACTNIGSVAWNHLNQLASEEMAGRGPGQKGHKLAQNYIEKTFVSLSSYRLTRQEFIYQSHFNEKTGVNWYVSRKGLQPNLGFIAITAHYDHLGTNSNKTYYGADDNASGTAAILALAQCLDKVQLRHSVIIIAIDREEHGLYGAKSFIHDNPHLIEQFRVNVNLDMVGHGNNNRHYWLTGTRRWPDFAAIVERTNANVMVPFKPRRTLFTDKRSVSRGKIDLHRASDHYEFFKVGVPYLFITGENHKDYHQQTDTLASINADFYQFGIRSIAQLIMQLDQNLQPKKQVAAN
ncbi:M28 family peptidase [Thalassotalea litorea]|uniref:M28 family peptidase n=1 Tax=Thalassotalea litorea TaxID=2020715 RepID=A0A5R9IKZ5_9GAMM|nr:M28 family peptidase [Thalassotalea litorea]TLU66195.1 M28 family peptidase [Thalassotalea litorea]